MSRSYHHRGVSLVEILVASGLLGLILLVTAQLIIPAARAWDRQQKRTESAQGNLVAINWLEKDLSLSKPSTVAFGDDGKLSLVRSEPQIHPERDPFRIFVVYQLEEGTLFRSQQEFEPEKKEKVEALKPTKRQAIARSVSKFVVETPQDWITSVELASSIGGRSSEIRTAVASVYAPLDAAVEEKASTPLESQSRL